LEALNAEVIDIGDAREDRAQDSVVAYGSAKCGQQHLEKYCESLATNSRGLDIMLFRLRFDATTEMAEEEPSSSESTM
jgi:hypothetical protein